MSSIRHPFNKAFLANVARNKCPTKSGCIIITSVDPDITSEAISKAFAANDIIKAITLKNLSQEDAKKFAEAIVFGGVSPTQTLRLEELDYEQTSQLMRALQKRTQPTRPIQRLSLSKLTDRAFDKALRMLSQCRELSELYLCDATPFQIKHIVNQWEKLGKKQLLLNDKKISEKDQYFINTEISKRCFTKKEGEYKEPAPAKKEEPKKNILVVKKRQRDDKDDSNKKQPLQKRPHIGLFSLNTQGRSKETCEFFEKHFSDVTTFTSSSDEDSAASQLKLNP